MRGSGAILPGANDENHDAMTPRPKVDEGEDPGGAIEAGGGGRGEHRGAVFLHEGLFDQAVAVAAADGGHQFVAHAVGVGAADVVAFEQNLVAAADAHELVADFVEASGGIAGAGQGEHGEGQQGAVEQLF